MTRRIPKDLPTQVLVNYPVRRGKFTVKVLMDPPNYENVYVLFEGSKAALEFVGRLFIAQARYTGDCHYHIAPIGPGGRIFSDDSTLGLYIHRLPCTEKKGLRMANATGTNTKFVIKQLQTMAPGWSRKASIQARERAGVKFASLYRRAKKAWPATIRISDGRRVHLNDQIEPTPMTGGGSGGIGHFFPTLSEAYSAAEDRMAGSPHIVDLMLWTIFGELHAEATRRLEQGSKRLLRVSELDRKAVAQRLIRNLNVRGWERQRTEFLRANPDLHRA
jgi:hypothetical protein